MAAEYITAFVKYPCGQTSSAVEISCHPRAFCAVSPEQQREPIPTRVTRARLPGLVRGVVPVAHTEDSTDMQPEPESGARPKYLLRGGRHRQKVDLTFPQEIGIIDLWGIAAITGISLQRPQSTHI